MVFLFIIMVMIVKYILFLLTIIMKELFKRYAELKIQRDQADAEMKEILPKLLKTGLKEVVADNYLLSYGSIPRYKLNIKPETVKKKYPTEYNKSLVIHEPTLRKLLDTDSKVFKKINSPHYKVKELEANLLT